MDAWAEGGYNPDHSAHWVGEAREATVLKDIATLDFDTLEDHYRP